ncbi:MAG: HAD-IIB family hydrolase [Spirochaetes bacterium]|nr:HAD-IIB family hydrolase [Spirochaetota bacterium]
MSSIIVFSDYDGTIAENGSVQPKAKEALQLLRKCGIPLIIASSKTFDELTEIYRELHLHGPIIFENGSGVAVPTTTGYDVYQLGVSIDEIQKLIPLVETVVGKIQTILDMEVDRLCEYSGLTRKQAIAAKNRKFSLPFIVKGGIITRKQNEKISAILARHKFTLRWGGKFYHLVPTQGGKGNGIRWVMNFFRLQKDALLRSAAIGNSENDFDMLDAVDYPFFIKNKRLHANSPTATYTVTREFDVEGFYEAVEKIIMCV